MKNWIAKRKINPILKLCMVYYIIMAMVTPGFFTFHNSWNLLYNLLPLLILAVGQTYVMITAGIDLSITSIIAVCSVSGAYIMSDNALQMNSVSGILLAMVLMLVIGILIGAFNGIAVAKFHMPAFMVTLTTMMLFSGLAIWFTKSQNIYNLPEAFVTIPYKTIVGIPIPIVIILPVLALAFFLLKATVFGEWVYAIGQNIKTAHISGVKVNRTAIFVYMVSGFCAAVASILYTARLETGSPVMGQTVLLDVIGAVVIGGTSLFGGRGKIEWTIYGALFMIFLDNSLNLLGLSFFIIMIFKGAVILTAALLNRVLEGKVKTI